jgi:hypothetical protein
MNAIQLNAVEVILHAAATRLRIDPLANLNEGSIKAIVSSELLTWGFALYEGAQGPKRAKIVRMKQGELSIKYIDRVQSRSRLGSENAWNSIDLCVVEPCELRVEIQVRTIYGTLDGVQSRSVLDDIERVLEGFADAFLLAADRRLYDALRGIKESNRGRKAIDSDRVATVLPGFQDLQQWPPEQYMITHQVAETLTAGGYSIGSYGIEKVVVCVWK